MPTPRPIIAVSCGAKSGIDCTLLIEHRQRDAGAEPEQRGDDRQAHRDHRSERDEQDDDGGEEAERLALGHLELGEHVAAVLDRQPVDVDVVAELLDLVAEVDELLVLEVGDLELGERDRVRWSLIWLRALGRVRARSRRRRRARRLARTGPPSRRAPRDRRRPARRSNTIWPVNPARFGLAASSWSCTSVDSLSGSDMSAR